MEEAEAVEAEGRRGGGRSHLLIHVLLRLPSTAAVNAVTVYGADPISHHHASSQLSFSCVVGCVRITDQMAD